MAPGMNVHVAKQAELLKQEGNTYFKKERLGAAIEAYTQAITLCPNVPAYWTNRALCHRKRDDWEKVEADCRKALELDTSSVKILKLTELREQLKSSDRFFPRSNKVLQIALGCTTADEIKDDIHKASAILHGDCGLFFTNLPKEEGMRIFESFEEYDFVRIGAPATEMAELKEHEMEPFLRK